ncbi:MAG: orotidine-5'-phosphate decarboxylase [Ruminococcaceae bacterium]|nr:orotidine-5'-phosphate decarboxylase [Oscillospiraceae bacterium]
MDVLLERIDALRNPTVVGLDPTLEMIPAYLREEKFAELGKTPEAVAEMFLAFNEGIMKAVQGIVPAVKPQIAFYERYGLAGLAAYEKTCAMAQKMGFVVIGDIKRGDIGSTAAAYAAHIGGTEIGGERFDLWHEDYVTVNPYLGVDGIKPFVDECNRHNKGIFVLVKTSNPSSSQLQDLLVDGKPVYLHMAALVEEWGQEAMGEKGYSRVGAVIGATHREQGAAARAAMPHTFFLVPGYGAQGGTAEDIRGFFDKDGRGCIVNSSRGIIAAWKKSDKYGEHDFAEASRAAALAMQKDIMG